MPEFVKVYLKAIVATLTALAAWGQTAAPDGITTAEWWGLPMVAVVGLGVLIAPNAFPIRRR